MFSDRAIVLQSVGKQQAGEKKLWRGESNDQDVYVIGTDGHCDHVNKKK